jgi:hypothetical protein
MALNQAPACRKVAGAARDEPCVVAPAVKTSISIDAYFWNLLYICILLLFPRR